MIYDMGLITMIARVSCPANVKPILNENHPTHFIHLSLKNDTFPLILYSYISVRNSRATSPSLLVIPLMMTFLLRYQRFG